MAIIVIPARLALGAGCEMGEVRSDSVDGSDPSQIEQARVFGPPRWRMMLTSPPNTFGAGAEQWASLRTRLMGSIHVLEAWPIPRVEPRGTMRGTITVQAVAAAGAGTITLTGGSGQAGKTLLDGDWLQIGAGLGTSQLIRVNADATANASGVITITFDHVLRSAAAAGAAVTWDKPRCYWRRTDTETAWSYTNRRIAGAQTIELVEVWR